MDPNVYNPIYGGRSKKIQVCFTIGFNVEGKWCMARAADDLTVLGATLIVKSV